MDTSDFEATLRGLEKELKTLLALADPTKDSITPDKAIGRLEFMPESAHCVKCAARR